MFFIVGIVIVIGSVLGGFLGGGGHFPVLFQPFEFLIIIGGAVGGFIIANPKPVLISSVKIFG
ncbi:MAG: motility-associated protein, partial [Alphaproteobacteria bacterium]